MTNGFIKYLDFIIKNDVFLFLKTEKPLKMVKKMVLMSSALKFRESYDDILQ